MDRGSAPLGIGYHLDDLAKHRVGTDSSGFDDQAASAVDRRTRYRVTRRFFDRYRLTGYHRFIDGRATINDLTVHGNFLSRSNTYAVSHLNIFEWDFFFTPVRPDNSSCLGSQVKQGPDGRPRSLARAKLHDLAQQNENNDHGASFEIDAHMAVRVAKALWEDVGHNHCGDGEDVSGSNAHPDQGEHVEVSRDDRLCATLEERPAGPQDDRCCQNKLSPTSNAFANGFADKSQSDKRSHG